MEEEKKVKEPACGTRAKYNSKKWACRCPKCKAASRAYMRARRIKQGLGVRGEYALPGQLGIPGVGEDK